MLRCVFCVITGYLLFSLMIVFAQSPAPSSKPSVSSPKAKTRIVYKEKSYYDFEDTLIRGDKAGPEGSSVFRKNRVQFKSSLNLKRSFMPELKASGKEIR